MLQDRLSWWGQVDGNHHALLTSRFVKALVHKASLQLLQSSGLLPYVVLQAGICWPVASHWLSPVEAAAGNMGGMTEAGRPSLSCTMHLICHSIPQEGPGVGLILRLYLSYARKHLSWACPPAPPTPGALTPWLGTEPQGLKAATWGGHLALSEHIIPAMIFSTLDALASWRKQTTRQGCNAFQTWPEVRRVDFCCYFLQ